MSLLKAGEFNYKANQTSIAPKFDHQLSYNKDALIMKRLFIKLDVIW